MKISRRNFLKGSLTTLFVAGFNLPIYALNNIKKNLVVISLRGGMDGLCALPIKNDKNFEKLRPDLILDKNLEINSDFVLHPSLSTFHELWKEGKSSFVHATSIPYTGRSHFDGQDLMESGGKVPYQIKTGWLGRGMKIANLEGDGLALALPMPLLLRGVPKNDNYYPAKGKLPDKEILEILSQVYSNKSEAELKSLLDIVKSRPKVDTSYGQSSSRDSISLAKKAAKMMIKPNGPRVAVFEVHEFDTHSAQGGVNGTHSDCLSEIDDIVRTLKKYLAKDFDNTLIVTLTEFGRTIKQNSGLGTEHGYGGAVLMAGGLLKKAQIYSDWPGLKKKELFEKRDLNSTIDARSIYASAMSTVFDLDFKRFKDEVFWGENLQNLSDKLFKNI